MSDEVFEGRLRVVLVEDDARLARLTAQYLESHRVEVTTVARGDLAVAEVLRVRPDAVLLDLMLPGIDGNEVCRQLRRHIDVPVIMITARTDEADRVRGLEGGADDYVPKPFSSRELLARIRANVRRAQGKVGPQRERLTIGELVIDPASRTAQLGEVRLALTSQEFQLLRVLGERAGQVLSREQLLDLLHGSTEDSFDRSIDVHVSRLRHKLESDPRHPRFLKTIRGVGYMLASEKP
ncbi:MAG TPA: response regulator transcription factor [Polyangiaceae bacterium]|nr:response regulator transcription factor [Polyangiaceae bacterium]